MTQYNYDFLDYLGGLETETAPAGEKEIDATCAAVLKKAGLAHQAPKTRRAGRILLIAAAVAVCAAVTAAAAGFNIGEMFRGYFGTSDPSVGKSAASLTQSQVDTLNKSGTFINQSAVSNGTTITLKAAVGDQSSTYILFDVTAPEGTKLSRSDYDFEKDEIDFHHQDSEGASAISWYISAQPDADPGDNKKAFILRIDSAGLNLQGRDIDLSLANLSTPGKKKLTFDPLVKGTWKFELKLDYPTASKELTVNRTAHYKGGGNTDCESTVKSISLSPLSVIAELSGKNMALSGIPASITIRYRDGTQTILSYLGGAGGPSTGCTIVRSFDTPVDVGSIASVTIGDLTIPVS